MTDNLPLRLQKEPLIDAVFEVRYSSAIPASNILPGVFFSKYPGKITIERLPTSELPQPLLQADPNLQFAPLIRLYWKNFVVLIGDRSLAVGCKLPYPGWANFKIAIIEIITLLRDTGIVETIQRFSMKYVDLIRSADISEQISMINASVVVGDHVLQKEAFSLRMEIPENGCINAVQIVSSAIAALPDGSTQEGVIIDIDTISSVENQSFDQLLSQLDAMHATNKAMFFKCLRPETIETLGPVYE